MCQLLGMNCAQKTDFTFSLRGFCKRGGESDVHSHGFGLCLYQGRGLQCFHDTEPACKSPVAQLLQNTPMRTLNMMAHIRYATQGEVSLENVHPFSRVWKGVQMCFCHNGDVPKFSVRQSEYGPVMLGKTTERDILYHPVGDTDSEAVFCAILNALHAEFPTCVPTLPVLHEFLNRLCHEIVEDSVEQPTIFNFLLACGQYTMFAYSWPGQRPGSKVWNGLWYLIREPPFSLASLLDDDYTIDFDKVTTSSDRVAVIATKPLTKESGWTEFKPGELILFDQGNAYRSPQCCEVVERQGRGLVKTHKWVNVAARSNRKLNQSPNQSPQIQPAFVPPLSLAAAVDSSTSAATGTTALSESQNAPLRATFFPSTDCTQFSALSSISPKPEIPLTSAQASVPRMSPLTLPVTAEQDATIVPVSALFHDETLMHTQPMIRFRTTAT